MIQNLPRPSIMFPAEDLNLPPPGTHALNHTVRFIRFPTRFSDLAHDDICIEAAVRPGRELEIPGLVGVCLDAY